MFFSSRKAASESLPTPPWRRRTDEGVYFGHNGDVWAYFEWPLTPLQWEDAKARLSEGMKLSVALTELGDMSADLGGGMKALAIERTIHVFGANFDKAQPIPKTSTEAHLDFLHQVLPAVSPAKTLLIGVKLWPRYLRSLVRGSGAGTSPSQLLAQAKQRMSKNSSNDSFEMFREDYEDVAEILRRSGADTPAKVSLANLESWFNFAKGPDAQVLASPTSLHVTGGGEWEISAVTDMTRATLDAPNSQWVLEAMAHADPASAVSIRADLTPNTVVQGQLRQSQRKLRAAEEEEARTGDISRDEIGERAAFAKDLENVVRSSAYSWLTNTSILFARAWSRHEESNSTYRDMLRNAYGIETKPLENRQLELLDEMQPCGTSRVNPFVQAMNPAMVAFSGIPSFSNIGDPGNLWIGRADPDWPAVFVEAAGAPRQNKPPGMAIFGDPGSGKAQPLTAKVLTPSGWVTMGSLRVGSDVVSRDGGVQQVTGLFPQGVQPVYRLEFDDGSSTVATGDHLWSVTASAGRGQQLATTEDLLASLSAGATWRIPMAEAFGHAPVEVSVAPYEVGFNLTSSIPELRALLFGSLEQRSAVLTGLWDAYATGTDAGPALCLPHGAPVEDVVALIQGLGGTATLVPSSTHSGACLRVALPGSQVQPSRTLQSVELVGEEEAQCISVSSPDRLYVTDDHIVTHNTFTAQLIAGQAALSGTQTIMINPKGFDSLSSFVDWVREYDIPGTLVSMSALEDESGAFDPFRFAEPQMAAEILLQHINGVLGSNYMGGLTGHQELLLGEGLLRGAEAGARCAYDALQYVEDPETVRLVLAQAKSSSLFRLGFGYKPQPPIGAGQSGLTLVEFDRELRLPEAGKAHSSYEREERLAVSAMRLVTRASMEMLMRAGGGVLVVDEAHHYLGTPEGLASIQRLGREGRSLGLLPIFVTQRVSDLLDKGMENYLSRVMVMKLTDETQAHAALTLCGLKPTKERIEFLRGAGPRQGGKGRPGRPPLGFFRDLDDRHSVLMVGPIPEDIRLAFSTNPDDRKKRARLKAGLPAEEEEQ